MTESNEFVPIAERVAQRVGIDVAAVETVMAAHGVAPASVPAAQRSMRIARLRIAGEKVNVPTSGPFDRTFVFPAGVVMIVGPNLRGKSSILEIITLCLRGSGRDLQADVASWLRTIECDVVLNAFALGVRLSLDAGEVVHASIYQAQSIDELPSAVISTAPLIEAHSSLEYAAAIESLMMDRLDLEPIHAKDARYGLQRHGWPSYFSAIYPPAGGDRVLIGETAMAGLAGRLLSVFLDLPRTAVLTRIKTAASNLAGAATSSTRPTDPRTANLRAEQEKALEDAQVALAELPPQQSPSATEAAARVTTLAAQFAEAERERRELIQVHRQATAARQEDEQALNNWRESEVAARLFHGLDPVSCPRCETPVAGERRSREASDHVCAVCSTTLVADEDEDLVQEVVAEREAALDVSRATEEATRRLLEDSALKASELASELQQADEELSAARAARETDGRLALEAAVVRAESAIEMLTRIEEPIPPVVDPTQHILEALAEELEKEMRASSADLLEEVGVEIASIAEEFGIDAVTGVRVNLAAALRIEKGGVNAGSFGSQSPGERLRLRLATIIALLRVGKRRGIATHPGLLMLDSLRAEEVQESDAHAVLDALVSIASETPGLQIITTSADEALPVQSIMADHVMRPDEDGLLW